MKRILIVCCAVFIALATRAQSFSWTNGAGTTFDLTITDATKKCAEITGANSVTGTTEFTVPGTVTYNGNTYTVTAIAGRITSVNGQVYSNGLKKIILSEGIKILKYHSIDLAFDLEEVVFPTTLEIIEDAAFRYSGLKHVDLSRTKLRVIGRDAFNSNVGTIESIKFPQTLRRLREGALNNQILKNMVLPAQLDTLSYLTFQGLADLEEITFERPMPALLYMENPLNPSEGPFDPFRDSPNLQKIYVPVDAAKAYMDAPWWALHGSKYREQLTIGATGYTSYYLENENFEVPAGCTAYIITGITPSGKHGVPSTAHAQAFGAGKIIPKRTGFILQGTPSSTIEYQANVTGTEENVTGNLLVGTATEQEFSSASYKYYILSNSGDQGLGFYKQGTRDGASIKLKPHRAGLRLPAGVAPAKGIIIDFDEAEPAVTAIDTPAADMPKKDIIYNLQGQRVARAEHGIYIINGKKVIK